MRKPTSILLISALSTMLWACDGGVEPSYEIPETYTFDNVSYSGQTARLNMLEEMTTYMKTANTAGTTLDAATLLNMYRNENDPFTFTADKQLKNKTFELDQALFETRLTELARISASTAEATNGTAGRITSNDGSKTYLVDENGMEILQLVEKGLMGATFYYQGTAVYLSDEKIGPAVDNETITEGKGTDMEHHWDEAFGYLGVPTDFPANPDDARFWGKYSNGRDALLNTNQRLMDAFTAGRAAISNNDDETKLASVTEIRLAWEEVAAGTAIHYLNGGIDNLADDAIRNHELSEAIAFVEALKYNPERRISTQQIEQVLGLIGDNLYEVTPADLNAAIDVIAGVYGWENEKGIL